MLCADIVNVLWKDPAGRKRQAVGLLEDISPSGACLQMESPLPLGVELRWQCPKRQFSGRVQYCVYREIGYFVGVEFDSASRWSKRLYTPQHLLDLRRLLKTSGSK